MIPYLAMLAVMILSGLIAMSIKIGFWGGFFLTLCFAIFLFPFGPISVLPGPIILLLLRLRYRRRLIASDRVCPFSGKVRDECVDHFEER